MNNEHLCTAGDCCKQNTHFNP